MAETSHGKARPALPRSSRLPDTVTAPKPTESRSKHGHFGAGNRIAAGGKWKNAVRKVLGRKGAGEAGIVSRDARRVFVGLIKEFPHDGAIVRSMVAAQARHVAMGAYYAGLAERLGYDTPEGLAANTASSAHDQRAERLAVTALDIATRLARAEQTRPVDLAGLIAAGSVPRAPVEPVLDVEGEESTT